MRVLLLLLLLPTALAFAEDPVSDPLTEEVENLVRRLGDDDFRVRQQAYRDLKALGPRSVESLTKHKDHRDPNVVRLVKQLIEGYREEQQGALLSPLGSQENDFEKSPEMAKIVARGRAILPALHGILDEEDRHYPRYSYWRMRNTYAAIGQLTRDGDLDRLFKRLDHPNIQHRLLLRPILESLTREFVLKRIRLELDDPKAVGRIRARLLEMSRNSQLTRKEAWLSPLARRLVDDPDPEVRVAAVNWFAFRQEDAMVTKLITRTGDEDPRVRQAALRALRIYRSPEAVKALQNGLRDPEGEVRAAALETLRLVSGPEIAPLVRPFLRDPEPLVRSHAAKTLGALKDQASLPTLIELLANRDEESLTYQLHAVVDALRSLANPAALDPLLKLLADAESYRRIETYRYHILSAIIAVGGEDVLPKIKAHLEDPTLQNGHIVIEAIARLDTDKAIPFLIHAIENGDSRYRTSAVRGIGQRGYAKAAPAILKAMGEEEDAWFLSEALRAITEFGLDPGEELIAKLLAFDASDVQNINLIYTAIRAAVRFRMKSTAARITEILTKHPDRYAYRAVDALGRLGDPIAIPVLEAQFAREKYASTKYRIALALARLGKGTAIEKKIEEMGEAKDAPTLATLAESLQALGRADEARRAIQAADDAGPDGNTIYNMGCVLSLLGDKDKALTMIDRAFDGKTMYRRNLQMDADLDPIRDDPRFAVLMKKAK